MVLRTIRTGAVVMRAIRTPLTAEQIVLMYYCLFLRQPLFREDLE